MEDLKPYPKYKTIDLPWLKSIPEHWSLLRNKNVLNEEKEIVGENSDSYKLLSLTKQGVIYRNIESGKGKFPKEFNSYKIVNKNNLIFCLFDIDETPRTVGVSKYEGMITGAYDVFTVMDAIPNYIYYYYLSIDDVKGLKPLYTGLRKVIRQPVFLRTNIPLPPLSEQTQIANYLDYKVALINRFIRDKKKEIILLKEQKQAEINQAVTRGINPNAKMKDTGISWIGEIPEHWEEFRLKTRLQLTNNKISAQNQKSYLGMENIESWSGKYIATDSISEGQSNIFKTGNLLFGKLRPYLAKVYLAEFDGVCSTELLVYEIVKDNPKFMQYLLLSKGFIDTVNASTYGSKMPRANSNFIGNVRLPIPTIEEQQEIIDFIIKIDKNINTAISAIENQIKLIQEYKTSLISDVVTGKVDIRNIAVENTEDEPEEDVEEMEDTEEIENSEE